VLSEEWITLGMGEKISGGVNSVASWSGRHTHLPARSAKLASPELAVSLGRATQQYILHVVKVVASSQLPPPPRTISSSRATVNKSL
jgi:hypothetical protein